MGMPTPFTLRYGCQQSSVWVTPQRTMSPVTDATKSLTAFVPKKPDTLTLWPRKATRLITTQGVTTGAEQRYLTSYGWTAEVVEANLNRKLTNRTLRDQQMRKYMYAMGNAFQRKPKGLGNVDRPSGR